MASASTCIARASCSRRRAAIRRTVYTAHPNAAAIPTTTAIQNNAFIC